MSLSIKLSFLELLQMNRSCDYITNTHNMRVMEGPITSTDKSEKSILLLTI